MCIIELIKFTTVHFIIDKGGERDWKRTVYMYVHLQS